jgi:CDGSH-type Zn-finger protein
MTDPKIVQREPYVVEVTEGKTYSWCACGMSKNQPFCDGSHSGSGLSPVIFKATTTKTLSLCGCKHSKKGHLCDGTHTSLT